MTACSDCGKSFQKFNSFKSHIQRKHSENILADRQENEVAIEDNHNLHANSSEEEDHAEDVVKEEEPRKFVNEMTRFLALFLFIARKVESLWAVLSQMHSGISNKLSIIFLFSPLSDWFTAHLPNRIVYTLFLCIQNGGSKRKGILRVAE